MTAARNYVLYNPDSHLAGYYRNLVKAGMDPMEATKRVARALVRVIFRTLSSLVEKAEGEQLSEQNRKEGESDMASGSLRSDRSHESNISLSSLRGSKAGKAKRVKGTVTKTRKSKMSKKGKAVSTGGSIPCVRDASSISCRCRDEGNDLSDFMEILEYYCSYYHSLKPPMNIPLAMLDFHSMLVRDDRASGIDCNVEEGPLAQSCRGPDRTAPMRKNYAGAPASE
jgi:hypothetical protein